MAQTVLKTSLEVTEESVAVSALPHQVHSPGETRGRVETSGVHAGPLVGLGRGKFWRTSTREKGVCVANPNFLLTN